MKLLYYCFITFEWIILSTYARPDINPITLEKAQQHDNSQTIIKQKVGIGDVVLANHRLTANVIVEPPSSYSSRSSSAIPSTLSASSSDVTISTEVQSSESISSPLPTTTVSSSSSTWLPVKHMQPLISKRLGLSPRNFSLDISSSTSRVYPTTVRTAATSSSFSSELSSTPSLSSSGITAPSGFSSTATSDLLSLPSASSTLSSSETAPTAAALTAIKRYSEHVENVTNPIVDTNKKLVHGKGMAKHLTAYSQSQPILDNPFFAYGGEFISLNNILVPNVGSQLENAVQVMPASLLSSTVRTISKTVTLSSPQAQYLYDLYSKFHMKPTISATMTTTMGPAMPSPTVHTIYQNWNFVTPPTLLNHLQTYSPAPPPPTSPFLAPPHSIINIQPSYLPPGYFSQPAHYGSDQKPVQTNILIPTPHIQQSPPVHVVSNFNQIPQFTYPGLEPEPPTIQRPLLSNDKFVETNPILESEQTAITAYFDDDGNKYHAVTASNLDPYNHFEKIQTKFIFSTKKPSKHNGNNQPVIKIGYSTTKPANQLTNFDHLNVNVINDGYHQQYTAHHTTNTDLSAISEISVPNTTKTRLKSNKNQNDVSLNNENGFYDQNSKDKNNNNYQQQQQQQQQHHDNNNNKVKNKKNNSAGNNKNNSDNDGNKNKTNMKNKTETNVHKNSNKKKISEKNETNNLNSNLDNKTKNERRNGTKQTQQQKQKPSECSISANQNANEQNCGNFKIIIKFDKDKLNDTKSTADTKTKTKTKTKTNTKMQKPFLEKNTSNESGATDYDDYGMGNIFALFKGPFNRRKTTKAPRPNKNKDQEEIVNKYQTFILQSPPPSTTTASRLPETTPMAVKKHSNSLKSMFYKFLTYMPFLTLLKPLSFGFWTIALSPILVMAIGGFAIAVMLYPWLTISRENAAYASFHRPATVVVHKHQKPAVRIHQKVPLYYAKPTYSHNNRRKMHVGQTSPVPVSQRWNVRGALTKMSNSHSRKKRRASFSEKFSFKDMAFQNWLTTHNDFEKKYLRWLNPFNYNDEHR